MTCCDEELFRILCGWDAGLMARPRKSPYKVDGRYRDASSTFAAGVALEVRGSGERK